MKHPGTYNANPLSAAAGVATLKRVATGEPCDKANAAAPLLRNELNELFAGAELAVGRLRRLLDGARGARTTAASGPSTDAGDNDGLIPFGGDVNALDGPKNMKQVYGAASGDAAQRRGLVGLRRHDELRAHRRGDRPHREGVRGQRRDGDGRGVGVK